MAEADGVKPPVKVPLHDAARALQFVRSKAAEWNIDKQRIGAAGGSAGACSSLWLAMPMIGLPAKDSRLSPCPNSAALRVQPYKSGDSNQAALRNGLGSVVDIEFAQGRRTGLETLPTKRPQ